MLLISTFVIKKPLGLFAYDTTTTTTIKRKDKSMSINSNTKKEVQKCFQPNL